jgi:hypothetical protein
MAFGETFGDTLETSEQDFIADRCRNALPAHAFALHSNAEGITWAVLTPPAITPELLRFTICRFAPAVMVMIEDAEARRQIRGLESIEAAIHFVCEVAAEAETIASGNACTMH